VADASRGRSLARAAPCRECPFRVDVSPGKFPVERYELLRDTVGQPGAEQPIGAPLFACHLSPDGAETACAGWLATCGHEHLGVRMAVVMGAIPGAALAPQPGWPELHPTYEDVVDRMGG